MKSASLILLVVLAAVASSSDDYQTLSNAISSSRQRRSLGDHQLVTKMLEALNRVEEYGSEQARKAKADVMALLEKVEDFKFADWLETMKKEAKAAGVETKEELLKLKEELINMGKAAGGAFVAAGALGALESLVLIQEAINWLKKQQEKLRDKREISTLSEDENKKMMDKILLLAKLKLGEFKNKLTQAFDKLKAEFEPIGQKYKKYGETISLVAVDGLKQFAKANVDIFNQFQDKVAANLNGLLDDGKSFLNLVKEKTIKSFGK